MDQALFIIAQVQGVGITLTNIQAFSGAIGIVISTLIMWGLMTKNINAKIESKADKELTKTEISSIKEDIIEIKDTAKEDRALFLTEMRELRSDLKLKKDKA